MRTIASTIALAAALLAGTAATAQKKGKGKAETAAAYSPVLSKPFREKAVTTQAAVKANDPTARAKIDELATLAVSPDEKFYVANFLLDLGTATKDQKLQEAGITGVLASGSQMATPNAPQLNFFAGQFAYQAGNFTRAAQLLTEAERLGYKNDDLQILIADSYLRNGQIDAGLTAVDRAIAARKATGAAAPESWYKRAAAAAYKANNQAQANKWMRTLVAAYPNPTNWRDALVIYRDGSKADAQTTIDIYRLMRLTGGMAGERDYYEYAALVSERGLPGEAKAVVDEGFATSKAPRSSVALNEILKASAGKITTDRASLAGAERQANAAANGRVAANTADAYLGYKDFPKAIALYRLALQKGGVDVNQVNTRLGMALAQSGDVAGAKAAFAQVTGQRADVAAYWSLYLDQKA